MEDDTRRLLDLLAEALQKASLLCGKIIGNDDFANEPITRKSPFRIVSEGGKPSPYPDVSFRLLSDIQAEEKMSVYLPFGVGLFGNVPGKTKIAATRGGRVDSNATR